MASNRAEPVSPDELAAAREVMARASAFGVNTKTGGSMNDSVKRHRDHAQAEADDWEPVTYNEEGGKTVMCERVMPKKVLDQMPVAPGIQKTSATVSLPPGVTDLQDWGSTICALPKVASEKLSYNELMQSSKHVSYLRWVAAHGQNRGGRFEDLALFLKAAGFDEKAESSCYPGSSETRERKK